MHPYTISLRSTTERDLDTFFRFQLDPEANWMAAFTAKDPADRDAYISKWVRLLEDPGIHIKTVLSGDSVVGTVAKYMMDGEAQITYWIGKSFWGQGIATAALAQFLQLESNRPLYGRTAFDNIASQRVLEKCGFRHYGKDRGFANARNMEIEEFIYKLG